MKKVCLVGLGCPVFKTRTKKYGEGSYLRVKEKWLKKIDDGGSPVNVSQRRKVKVFGREGKKTRGAGLV